MCIAAQFAIAKCWKQPKRPSVNEWIKKQWYIYTMEYYAAERKKEFLSPTTEWMELESIMLSEINIPILIYAFENNIYWSSLLIREVIPLMVQCN